MGVIRKIVFLVLVLFTINLSAQNHYDTVYFAGNKFVEHFVKGGESLKKIAKLHNVKTSDIKEANELEKRLYYNQLLYIPININKATKSPVAVSSLLYHENRNLDTSVINIAVLMPYYLLKNDTMFYDYDDPLEIPNIYYKKSEAALSFHVGLDLACDSLRRAGKKIILHAFDTNNDTLEVRKILQSNKLDDMNIIIGPLYSRSFQILCKKYGGDKDKFLISPLSRNNKGIKKHPSVYQVSPSNKMQAEKLTDYLIRNKTRERIIILHDKQHNGLSKYIKHKFNKENKIVECFQISNTKVDSIRKYFVERQNVLLFSKNKAFISKILGSIGSIDSSSTIFTFESIKLYDNLDITNLMELDVHIPNSLAFNESDEFYKAFLNLFEKEYYTSQRKYMITGYNIVMHFCGKSKVYDFKRIKGGYYENSHMPLYHYSDYDLIPVN
tara:strand:- start:34644 stop:35966 length:1323 start_codon:yes stop_codon:yes gene_type:complete